MHSWGCMTCESGMGWDSNPRQDRGPLPCPPNTHTPTPRIWEHAFLFPNLPQMPSFNPPCPPKRVYHNRAPTASRTSGTRTPSCPRWARRRAGSLTSRPAPMATFTWWITRVSLKKKGWLDRPVASLTRGLYHQARNATQRNATQRTCQYISLTIPTTTNNNNPNE